MRRLRQNGGLPEAYQEQQEDRTYDSKEEELGHLLIAGGHLPPDASSSGRVGPIRQNVASPIRPGEEPSTSATLPAPTTTELNAEDVKPEVKLESEEIQIEAKKATEILNGVIAADSATTGKRPREGADPGKHLY